MADMKETLVRADLDMMMFLLFNGMERTKAQWEDLLAKTDPPLKIIKVWSALGDEQSVIETCLRD